MDVSVIVSFAQELRERLDDLNRQKQGTLESIRKTVAEIGKEAKGMQESAASDANRFILSQKAILLDKFEKIHTTLVKAGVDFPNAATPNYKNVPIDENRQMLAKTVEQIEKLCEELNGINFDMKFHPVEFTVDKKHNAIMRLDQQSHISKALSGEESFDSIKQESKELYVPQVKELSRLIADATARLEAIGEAYYACLGVDDYCKEVEKLKQENIAKYVAESNAKFNKTVNDRLLKWNLLNPEFFERIADSRRGCSPAVCDPMTCGEMCSLDFCDRVNDENAARYGTTDMKIICGNCSYYDKAEKCCSRRRYCGSLDFNTLICIGDLELSPEHPKDYDEELLAQSALLRQHCSKGVVSGPMILNLRKSGNLFIEEAGNCSAKTISFIHQYIQYFLLMQPSCRVNLCLIDCNDQCKFSRYSQLTALNSNALFKGIIRNEREIDKIIADMEKTMFDISDNKLSFNNVRDVFEYNEKSVENPQSLHLMVLMDFPEKYAVDTITHIEKIIANGNASGIYTIIVHDRNFEANFGSRMSMYENALASIKRNSFVLTAKSKTTDTDYRLENRCLNLGSDFYIQFTPDKGFDPENFSKNILPILSGNAQKQKQTVIPLQPMFELTDTEYAQIKRRDPLAPSKLIEIPIGKNGGEVQSIKFSTTGDNAAHALVIGGTGSGKSNLLHTIILNACYRYSADELQIYLIDFKGGVEFKFYEAQKDVTRQLPHIALTGLTSEPEDGVAILTNIRSILKERENLFRRNDVEDIVQYNEKYPNQILSRLLIIIDEVQELFAHEKLSEQALVILGELFKKGRAFGISILWASQTVPKAAGGGDFKDKVLSQIGNRICLKLNNADDAEAIGINPAQVRALNRPEKGLGIIFDGMQYVEFRVAYAEKKENRYNFVKMINDKWTSELGSRTNRRPLFIVGDDEIPLAKNGAAKYSCEIKPVRASKSNDTYDISIGQDYISGKPFEPRIALRGSKENCLIAGKNIAALRDLIGYAVLSVALENRTNADMDTDVPAIYCYNGELVGNEQEDLFNVLPEKMSSSIVKIQDNGDFAEKMLELYKIRKDRYAHLAKVHTPIFVFIHKMQILAEMFSDNKTTYPLTEEQAPQEKAPASPFSTASFMGGSMSRSGVGNSVTFREIMTELLSRGSDVGIHFVLTVNDPLAIPELKGEFLNFAHKIILNGVSNDSVAQLTNNYALREKTPGKEGVGFCYQGNEMSKFKLYRYDAEQDGEWLIQLLNRYNG